MVTVTGTATNAQDLFDKLILFLTTNVTLGAQQWTQSWAGLAPYTNDRVLEGPGLSGTDEILIGMRLSVDIPADRHWIEFRGMTGIIPTGLNYDDHINVQPIASRMFIDNDTMDYWFIANGRRFIVVLKISTVFEACYCGFFLPFGTPGEYPYPMFCGASAGVSAGSTSQPESWRDDVSGHSLFPFPNTYTDSVSSANFRSGVYILNPDGTWMECSSFNTFTEASLAPRASWYAQSDNYMFGLDHLIAGLDDLWGGGKVLMPIHIFETSPSRQTFGVLQGVYRCQGIGSATEDIITVSALNHLVIQNAFRTDFNDYFAVEI